MAAPILLPGTLVYLLARPLLALAHELLILLTADLLRLLASFGSRAVMNGQIPLDPVYTGTLFLLISDIQVLGVAVGRPLGDLLHATWPALFAAPDLVADGAWASAVIQPGASVVARSLAGLSGDVAFLLLGLLLVKAGWSSHRRLVWRGRTLARAGWLVVFGALLQAHIVVNHLADEPISLRDLEATGLTYGFSVLFTGPAAERPRLTALLGALPEPVRDGVMALGAVVVAYGLTLALVFGPALGWRLVGWLSRLRQVAPRRDGRPAGRPGLAVPRLGLAVFALVVAASPLGALAESGSRYLQDAPEPEHLADPPPLALLQPPAGGITSPAPTEAPEATATAAPAQAPRSRPGPAGKTVVTIAGSSFSYTYQVGGSRQVIRGMGYNPMYAQLPAAERAARYDHDFSAMRRAGVNTILGWVTEEFDGLLLDKAQEHGLGVILPYDLKPDLDYTDPAVRATVEQDVLGWVRRYKDHPALRMWGLGNEVLHKLVYPSWMKLRGDPALEARADAFATFYVQLIDEIHQIDPDHPVTYREAEDAYLPRMRDALNRGGVARPWFVYGINIYTPRLAEVIANWPNQGLDAPLLISEFAPGGAGPADRPRGYREMWTMIRAQPARVIGGAPYVWTTRGPEEVDRIFGLVDATGRPVDGSLTAIGRLFRGEASQEIAAAAALQVPPRPCDGRVTQLVVKTLDDIRANPHAVVFQASLPPSIMGPLDNLPPDPITSADLRVEQVDDPDRLAWQQASGYDGEWWATWSPPSRPGDQVALLIRQRAGQLEVAYVYHGPGASSVGGRGC